MEENNNTLLVLVLVLPSTTCNDPYALPPKQVPVHLPFVNPNSFRR
ncbi:hypothetical protein GLYMA_04G088601v4 [Glycine max]|nr:hypothetical protein GLYMA_04G088601v4 [Glycine max]KAH1110509.1 hypothetical protein GYH30_009379 [Glycine max]